MNFKKVATIAAVAGALAAITVPAMAFESQFSGTSRLRYFLSNYENGGGGNPLATTSGVVVVPTWSDSTSAKLKMNNYFEQRTRLFYTAKVSDDLKLVTGFEIDSVFGDRAQSQTTPSATAAGATGRNQGGALESDTVNLETKHVYLDFKIPSTPVRVTAGIQPIKDQLKGIFFDADVAGILASTKLGAATVNAGYFRGYDQSYFGTTAAPASTVRPRGMDNLDIGLLEGKYAVTKDINAGAVYYLYNDSRGLLGYSDIMIHTLGLTGDAKFGALNVSGFLAYQGGILKKDGASTAYLNAVAANVAGKMAIGPGTLKTAILFTSGNDSNAATNGHLTGWVGSSQSQNNTWAATAGTSTYNESGMMLLNRNAAAGTGTTDVAIVYNTGNGTTPLNMQGLYLYSLGYDTAITPKFYTHANLGMAWVAKTNSLKPIDKATASQNGSNFMGTELNVETGYKLYDNLTASVQAAYVMLGGFYKGSSSAGTLADAKNPENPYTVRTSLIFNF